MITTARNGLALLTPERFDAPLYRLPWEQWSDEPCDFTVTVAGPERYDGEKPFTYVVRDHTTESAWIQALTWHMRQLETLDAHLVASQSHAGLPPAEVDCHWIDLRLERQRATCETIIGKARDLVDRFETVIAAFRIPDGDGIDPQHYRPYDETRADFGAEALDLLRSLVKPT